MVINKVLEINLITEIILATMQIIKMAEMLLILKAANSIINTVMQMGIIDSEIEITIKQMALENQ